MLYILSRQDAVLIYYNTNLGEVCRKPYTPSLSQRTNQASMVDE
jgi:hypothetical protein